MSSKLKLILRGSSLRVFQTLVVIVISLYMMPFLMSELGTELYGLWIVIGSISAAYYLLDLGFNQAVMRYVSKYIHQNNADGANQIINTSLVIYTVMGGFVLLVSIAVAMLGAEKFMKGSENLTLAQTLLIITGISMAMEFPSKAFPGIIYAYMRFDFIAIVRLCKSVIDAVLMYYFVSAGYGLISMAAILLTTSLISTALYVWYTTQLFKGIKFSTSYVSFPVLKEIFHFSKWIFFLDVNNMTRSKMDIWFVSYYLSTGLLAIYYVAVRLIDYALQLLTQVTNISGPIFTEYYAKNDQENLTNSFKAFFKITLIFAVTVISGFYFLADVFITLWMGDTIDTHTAYVCLLILSLGRLVAYINSSVSSLLMALNKHKICTYISIVETMLSALLCFYFVPKYGLIGAAIGMSMPYVFQLLILPFYVAHQIRLNISPLVIRFTIFLLVSCSFWYFIKNNIVLDLHMGVLHMLILALAIVIIQILFSVILFEKYEKEWLLSKAINRFKKPKAVV